MIGMVFWLLAPHPVIMPRNPFFIVLYSNFSAAATAATLVALFTSVLTILAACRFSKAFIPYRLRNLLKRCAICYGFDINGKKIPHCLHRTESYFFYQMFTEVIL